MLKLAGNFIQYLNGPGHLQIVRDTGGRLREVEVQGPTQFPTYFALGDWDFPDFDRLHGENTSLLTIPTLL